jgi:hypothetical protein
MATLYRQIMGQTMFAEGKENFHVNKATVKFIMSQFLRYYDLSTTK